MADNGNGRGTVFVTGGSGFLGINLIRHLLKHGFSVVSFDLAPFHYPEADRITVVQGDVRNGDQLTQAMADCRYVVHAAAALPLYSREDIFTTDVDGTRRVLESAARLGIERIVHISSTAVYGVPDHHPLYETDSLSGVGPYGEAKILAEGHCEEYRQKGLCVPVLRPKSFIGPERLGVFALLYDWADDGHHFPILGPGRNRYQLLDVEDLCAAIRLCLEGEKDSVNSTFNIGAEKFTTLREDFQVVLDKAGYGKKIKSIPALPAIVLLKILEALHLSPLYQWIYDTVARDSFVSIEKAKNELGFSPVYSNQDALLRNFEWYRKNKSAFGSSSGISHRVPWSQGLIKWAKIFF